MNDAEIILIALGLYVAQNALLWGLGALIYLVAKRASESLSHRNERYWRDRQ
jgi:hypothetical protein